MARIFITAAQTAGSHCRAKSAQNMLFEFADVSGIRWSTSQCSTRFIGDVLPCDAVFVGVCRRNASAPDCVRTVSHTPRNPGNTII